MFAILASNWGFNSTALAHISLGLLVTAYLSILILAFISFMYRGPSNPQEGRLEVALARELIKR